MMGKFKKFIYLLTILFSVVILMAFNPFVNNDDLKNDNKELSLEANTSPAGLWVGWKTVDVTYRTSGNYVFTYSDIVSGIDPNHTMTWGCGYLDIDKPTPGWQCNVTKNYYTASGAESCPYIYLHSLLTPDPIHPLVRHTIDIRVKDDQGEESNWGGITLIIHYSDTPDSSEPANPCLAF